MPPEMLSLMSTIGDMKDSLRQRVHSFLGSTEPLGRVFTSRRWLEPVTPRFRELDLSYGNSVNG